MKSVHSVPLFNNIFPFFCPLIIDPAGRAVPGCVLCRLDGGILGGTSPATTMDTASATGDARDESTIGTLDLSALGESFGHTPLVVPVRGHLDSTERLLRGDVYIGRGLGSDRFLRAGTATRSESHKLADRSRSRVFGKHCALIRSSATRFGLHRERG